MPTRPFHLLGPAALLVLAAACRDAPLAPSATTRPLFAQGGNSDAAHACQQDGYLSLFRTDGTSFATVGDCVSYAAQGGVLATRLTATFTNISFAACNELTFGVEIDGVPQGALRSKPFGCLPVLAQPDTFVTFLSTQTLKVYLEDVTCSDIYLEDGLHALVTGSDPALIQITDSGGFCESDPTLPRPPDPRANLDVTRTIS